MRAGGGKAKGSQFEREVCVLLSKWVTNGKQEDVFWRSAMSGGRATVAKAHGKSLGNQVGDISCIDPAGQQLISKFAIECKFYADLNYIGLLTGKGKLKEFWEEIYAQAEGVNKLPMLFARQNRMPTFIGMNFAGLEWFGYDGASAELISPKLDLYLLRMETLIHVPDDRRPTSNRQRKRLIPF